MQYTKLAVAMAQIQELQAANFQMQMVILKLLGVTQAKKPQPQKPTTI
jgi:hypothetical protein